MSASELWPAAEGIARAALAAVAPDRLVRERVRLDGDRLRIDGDEVPLDGVRNVYLIAFGKAAGPMAAAMCETLGDRLTEGVVVTPEGTAAPSNPRVSVIAGGHPLPDERSVRAALAVLDVAQRADEDDLVVMLVSGGGSSLLCLPTGGVTLEEKREVTRALLEAGASIEEMNAVRKHLSDVKGGRLAAAAFPAQVVVLVLSDVVGNDLETIASGPAHWDGTTFVEARRILQRLGLWERVPESVRRIVTDGAGGRRAETMKPDDPVFGRVRSFILGDNMTALRAAKAEAEARGFEGIIMTASDAGEARLAAHNYVEFLDRLVCSLGRPLCFLAGGELTVTVSGRGRGGRNMEFVLAALAEIDRGRLGGAPKTLRTGAVRAYFGDFLERARGGADRQCKSADWLILSMGTDGIDGPTDAAGAWIDPGIFETVRALKLRPAEYLDDNDSYGFFEKTGRLIRTGPTGTNVMDLRVFLLSLR